MEPQKYTDEQVKDIKEREQKGLDALKELQLTPAAVIYKVMVGDDVFADKLTPFLRDTKYSPKKDVVSPIQPEDLPEATK